MVSATPSPSVIIIFFTEFNKADSNNKDSDSNGRDNNDIILADKDDNSLSD